MPSQRDAAILIHVQYHEIPEILMLKMDQTTVTITTRKATTRDLPQKEARHA